MAEFSTSSLELGRFDKSGNVPLTDQTKGPESGRGTKSFQLQQFADYIGDAAKVGGNAYQAKLNREAAENARIRQIEAFAKQEKTRQENEAKVKALKYAEYTSFMTLHIPGLNMGIHVQALPFSNIIL